MSSLPLFDPEPQSAHEIDIVAGSSGGTELGRDLADISRYTKAARAV